MTTNETPETPSEPMTEERFRLEAIRAYLALALNGATLQLLSERAPQNDTKNAMAYRCIVSANGRTHETTFSQGKGNVDAWCAKNIPTCLRQARKGLIGRTITDRDAALLLGPEALPSYRNSLDGAPKLAALRETYRPSLGTVLWALFRDADGIEDHEDWVSWAEDLGFFSDGRETSAQSIALVRKAMHDFEACRKSYFFLRSVFGSYYERLMELSREI